MSEETIIRNCSPTLAGIKTANLFSYRFESERELTYSLRKFNKILVKKGMRVVPLKIRGGSALIYAYRPSGLRRDLNSVDSRELLKSLGYSPEDPERCIVQLRRRLSDCSEFPHEIGLFLGYPAEDVRGFIDNKAKAYKCVGEWKVYGDVERAEKTFKKYKKCRTVYCELFAHGRSMERLTVAV